MTSQYLSAGPARGTIWWDFDGTLVSRPRMWSQAGHRLLSTHRPDLDVPFERLRASLEIGFPWHRPEYPHDELCVPDDWWDAVYDHYRRAFVVHGWDAIDDGVLTQYGQTSPTRPDTRCSRMWCRSWRG